MLSCGWLPAIRGATAPLTGQRTAASTRAAEIALAGLDAIVQNLGPGRTAVLAQLSHSIDELSWRTLRRRSPARYWIRADTGSTLFDSGSTVLLDNAEAVDQRVRVRP